MTYNHLTRVVCRMNWYGCAVAASITCALALFIQGFLPHKSHVVGYSSEKCCRAPVFNKTVLMVVDALRTDFVVDRIDSWSYLKQLVQDGYARVYNAKVHPPTVTLPRIKVGFCVVAICCFCMSEMWCHLQVFFVGLCSKINPYF